MPLHSSSHVTTAIYPIAYSEVRFLEWGHRPKIFAYNALRHLHPHAIVIIHLCGLFTASSTIISANSEEQSKPVCPLPLPLHKTLIPGPFIPSIDPLLYIPLHSSDLACGHFDEYTFILFPTCIPTLPFSFSVRYVQA